MRPTITPVYLYTHAFPLQHTRTKAIRAHTATHLNDDKTPSRQNTLLPGKKTHTGKKPRPSRFDKNSFDSKSHWHAVKLVYIVG